MVTSAINYAIQENIGVLNYSGFTELTTLDIGYDPIKDALENYSGLLIASAGNAGNVKPSHPAKLMLDNIISVGGTKANSDLKAESTDWGDNYSSCYGTDYVNLFAPGTEMISTNNNGGYNYNAWGTSFSAPLVTGTAALLKAVKPNLTTSEIKNAILNNVDKVSELSDKCTSGGRLNTYKALLKVFGLTEIKWDVLTVIIVGDYQRFHDGFTVTYGSSTQYKIPDNSGYTLDKWQLRGTKYDILATGTSKTVNVSYSDLVSAYSLGGRIYLDIYYKEASCIAAGTLITLADGSQKAVEELVGNEILLVWNLYTGSYDAAPIMFVDSDPIGHYEVIKLSFSDGTTVEVISEHGFWNVELGEYVYLDSNAAEYIGHYFLKQGANGMAEVMLTNVEISTEVTTVYSPVTDSHLCYYVNGMLSMPGGIEGLFNIFEVNVETMTYDVEALSADIEEYGLFTYEEFYEIYPIDEEVFEAFNGEHLKVAIGKGLITYERIGVLVERYSEFF